MLLSKKVWSELKSLTILVLIALCIRLFLFEPFFIPSTSMYDTLKIGDYILGTKYNYGYSRYSFPYSPNLFSGRIFASEPQRGDIIIFRAKNTGIEERFIKRLIGLPGDKIRISGNNIYINDKIVQHHYVDRVSDRKGIEFRKYLEILPDGRQYHILRRKNEDDRDITYNVPQGHYFFLGDNRDESADSRYRMGYISNQELIAKAQFIYFSDSVYLWLNHGSFTERIINIWTWLSSIRFNRMFHYLY